MCLPTLPKILGSVPYRYLTFDGAFNLNSAYQLLQQLDEFDPLYTFVWSWHDPNEYKMLLSK